MDLRHLLLALIAATFMICNPAEAGELTTFAYTVGDGDTMDSIARTYLPPNRGNSPRAFAEFKEGIFEYNYDRVFAERLPYELHIGDYLLITFWE